MRQILKYKHEEASIIDFRVIYVNTHKFTYVCLDFEREREIRAGGRELRKGEGIERERQ